jgi:hypothetical protein
MKKKSVLLLLPAVFSLLIASSCANPLVVALKEQIENDVDEALSGPAPIMLSSSLDGSSEEIPTSSIFSFTFDRPLDPGSVNAETIKLLRMPGETVVPITVEYDSDTKTLTLIPVSLMDRSGEYRVLMTTGVRSLQGASLPVDIHKDFSTRYFHDTEIGIDLTYSSADLELTPGTPVYIEFWPLPLEYFQDHDLFEAQIQVLPNPVISRSGKIIIPSSVLPEGVTSGAVRFFHDVDGDYASGGDDSDNDDTNLFYDASGAGNLSLGDEDMAPIVFEPDDPGDPDSAYHIVFVDINGNIIPSVDGDPWTPSITPAFVKIKDDFVMKQGQAYSLVYSDGSSVDADAFESGDTNNNYRLLNHGSYETARNLHSLDDVDYFTFTPAASDVYQIRVKNTGFDIKVGLYGSDSNMLTGTYALAQGDGTPGTDTWIVDSDGTFLTGGHPYFLRVESPSSGMGGYNIGYFYKPAAADASEDNDDVTATATELLFGRDNELTRTLEAEDTDYFEIAVENGVKYIVEVVEDPSYFNYSAETRDIDFDLSFCHADGSCTSFGDNPPDTLIIPDPETSNYGGAGTYYVKVSNNSTGLGSDYDVPGCQYRILLTYAPDSADSINIDENEHGPNSFSKSSYVALGADGITKTIYSTTEVNPEDDVDWIRFRVNNITTECKLKIEPVDGAGGEDGIVVNYEIYPSNNDGSPNTSGDAIASSGPWNSDPRIRGSFVKPDAARTYSDSSNPTQEEKTWWVKVSRALESGGPYPYSGNSLTGAYKLTVIAGADSEDNYYESPAVNDGTIEVSGDTLGLDETPWISSKPTRNELTLETIAGGVFTHRIYRTIYRKDYFGSTNGAEGDGVTDISSDYEFFWFKIPSTYYIPLKIDIASFSSSAIPLKMTSWCVSAADWTALTGSTYFTETDLGTAYDERKSTNYYGSESLSLPLDGSELSVNDYVVFKVEIDNSRTGGTHTYTGGGNTTHTYQDSGEYSIQVIDN